MTTFGPWSSNGHTDLGYDYSYSGQNLHVDVSLATHWSFDRNSCTLSWSGSWSGSVPLTITASNGQTQVIWSGDFTQAYGTTATLNFTISGFYDGTNSNSSVSFSATLNPATGQVTLSSTTFNMGDTVTIYPNAPDTSEQLRISWKPNGGSQTYIYGTYPTPDAPAPYTSAFTWNTSLSTMAALVPNATSLSGVVYCEYFSSSGTGLGYTAVNFTANVPSSVVPTVSAVASSDTASPTAASVVGAGLYVANYSDILLKITGGAGVYGSTISSATATLNGTSYAATWVPADSAWEVNLPNYSGSGSALALSATVTDSRGRTSAAVTGSSLNVMAYSPPPIPTLAVTRWTGNPGAQDDLGTSVRTISNESSISSLMNGTEKNTLTWSIDYQPVGGAWVIGGLKAAVTLATGTLSLSSTDILTSVVLSNTQSYNLRLVIADKFYTSTTTMLLPVGTVTMSWDKVGVGVGKVRQNGTLDVNGTIYGTALNLQGGTSTVGALSASGNVSAGSVSASGNVSAGTITSGMITQNGNNVIDAGTQDPHIRLYLGGAAQSIPSSTWTTVLFDTLADAVGTSFSYASGVVTVNSPGLYLITAAITGSASNFAAQFRVNGTTTVTQTQVGSGVSLTQALTHCRRFASGTTIGVNVYATSAISVSTETTNQPTEMTITRLGP